MAKYIPTDEDQLATGYESKAELVMEVLDFNQKVSESEEQAECRALESFAQFNSFALAIERGVSTDCFIDPVYRLIWQQAQRSIQADPNADFHEISTQLIESRTIPQKAAEKLLALKIIPPPDATASHVETRIRRLIVNAANRKAVRHIHQADLLAKQGVINKAREATHQAVEAWGKAEVSKPMFAPTVFDDYPEQAFTPPDILIHNMVYRGHKMLFSGASKARKTWLMVYLLLCIQAGKDFFGFITERKPVLIIDLELIESQLLERVRTIATAAGIWNTTDLHVISLRGKRVEFAKLKIEIVSYCKQHGIAAIGIDPVYRVKTGEENSNDDAAEFMLEVESLASDANAAVILAHHFAKGGAASKASIDRMSGAGVWARDPDVLMSMTEAAHSTAEVPAFVIEPTLRDFAPVKPFVIKWDYPLWSKDDRAPTELKGAAGRPKADGNPAQIMELIEGDEEVQSTELQKAANENFGIPKRRFFELIKNMLNTGTIRRRKEGRSSFYAINTDQSFQKTETL